METLLIVGAETVTGANLAAVAADRFHVVTVPWEAPVHIADCESAECRWADADSVRQLLAIANPQWIVICGPGCDSTWSESMLDISLCTVAVRQLAIYAREAEIRLTHLSSDAVFRGPWMFHDESSSSYCSSPEAVQIRSLEETVCQLCPQAAIVRTHTYGFSPFGGQTGWMERLISHLEAGAAGPFDCGRHATPIPATHLAEVLLEMDASRLSGVFHVGGAERTNPAKFVQRLAEQFNLPAPRPSATTWLNEPPTGFACGETSLNARTVRKQLGIAVPTVTEGLTQLHTQYLSGFADKLQPAAPSVREKVA